MLSTTHMKASSYYNHRLTLVHLVNSGSSVNMLKRADLEFSKSECNYVSHSNFRKTFREVNFINSPDVISSKDTCWSEYYSQRYIHDHSCLEKASGPLSSQPGEGTSNRYMLQATAYTLQHSLKASQEQVPKKHYPPLISAACGRRV